MAFTQETFALLSAQATDTPKVYVYRSTDSLLQVTSTNYFYKKRHQLEEDHQIVASLSDGLFKLRVTSDVATVEFYSGKDAFNQTIINTINDFPAPVGGVITPDGTVNGQTPVYKIGANIDLGSNRIQCREDDFCVMIGDSPASAGLSSTTTEALITGIDSILLITGIALSAPLGRIYDLTQNDGLCLVVDTATRHLLPSKPSLFDNLNISAFFSSQFIFCATGVFSLSGATYGEFLCDTCNFDVGNNGVIVELGVTVCSAFSFLGNRFVSTATNDLFGGLVDSGNILDDTQAMVSGTRTVGTVPTFVNISPDDIRWEFQSNSKMFNSSKAADMYLSAAQTTTINTIGVYVPIGGVNWLSDVGTRFSVSTGGLMTFLSETTDRVMIIASATLSKVGGGFDVASVRIAINGVTQVKTTSDTESNRPTVVASQGLFTMSEGDTIQLYVANKTSTANIISDTAGVSAINGF